MLIHRAVLAGQLLTLVKEKYAMSPIKSVPFFFLLLLVAVAGCSEPRSSHSTTDAVDAKVATVPVNANCPIMGNPVDPAVTVQWNDQTVGFCCADCIPAWNKLSDQEKQAKLDAAGKYEASKQQHSEHKHHDEKSHE